MIKNILTLSIFVLASSLFYSQNNYTILSDDPNYAKLMAGIGVAIETDIFYRTEILMNFASHYQLSENPIELSVNGNLSLYSERKKSFYPRNLSANEYQNFNTFDISGTYNFMDNTKNLPVKVILNRMTNFGGFRNTTTITYIMVNGEVRKRFGSRMGVFRYAQSLTDFDASNQSIAFADGSTLPYVENAWNHPRPSSDDNFIFTAERHFCATFGIVFHKSTGIVINHDGYGRRGAERNIFLYADALINLASDIQKISYEGRLYDMNEAISGVELKKIGFRVGAKHVTSSFYTAIEFGQRPTYFQSKFFLKLTLGYSFNKNI